MGSDGDFDAPGIRITELQSINGDAPANAGIVIAALEGFDVGNLLLGRRVGEFNQLVTAADRTNDDGFRPVYGSSDPGSPGEPAWYTTEAVQSFGRTLTEVQSLVAALKSGKPLPIAINAFNLAVSASKATSGSGLSTAASGLNAVNEFNNFFKAVERGDKLAAVASGAAFARSALVGVQSMVEQQIINEFGSIALAEQAAERSANAAAIELTSQFKALGELIGNISKVLPFISLIVAVRSGDELSIVGAFAGVLQLMEVGWAGPIGWAIAAYQILDMFFNDPDIYAEAKLVANADGVTLAPLLLTVGDGGAEQATVTMGDLLKGLQGFLDTNFPEDDRQLIAQRLPWLRFEGDDSGGGTYIMRWHDSATGVVQARRFDTEWKYLGTGEGSTALPLDMATDDNFFRSMGEQFVELALGDYQGQSAWAPRWAAQTAYAQAHRGHCGLWANAGERRARGGQRNSRPGANAAANRAVERRRVGAHRRDEYFRRYRCHGRVNRTVRLAYRPGSASHATSGALLPKFVAHLVPFVSLSDIKNYKP